MGTEIIALLHELKPYEKIDGETELIASKIVDSLAIIQLTALLEDRFDVTIADDELTRENFATVAAIENLIKRSKKS